MSTAQKRPELQMSAENCRKVYNYSVLFGVPDPQVSLFILLLPNTYNNVFRHGSVKIVPLSRLLFVHLATTLIHL